MVSGSEVDRKPCHEAHITLAQTHRVEAQQVADATGWTFSEITGCPILGQGTYCYLTGYDPDAEALLDEMGRVSDQLVAKGALILREKIERIIYDTRTHRNEVAR